MITESIQNCIKRFPELEELEPIDQKKYQACEQAETGAIHDEPDQLQLSLLGQLLVSHMNSLTREDREEIRGFSQDLYHAFQDDVFTAESIWSHIPDILKRVARKSNVDIKVMLVEMYIRFGAVEQHLNKAKSFYDWMQMIPAEMIGTIFIPQSIARQPVQAV